MKCKYNKRLDEVERIFSHCDKFAVRNKKKKKTFSPLGWI